MNPRFVTNEEALLRGSRNLECMEYYQPWVGCWPTWTILTTLDVFLTTHVLRGVRFLTTLDRFLTTQVLRGVRFLTTLDRFLTPPNFRGGQEPVHPGQVPDTPEKLNFTKILKTWLKLNFSKKFFHYLFLHQKLEFWGTKKNSYLEKKISGGSGSCPLQGF